MDEIVYLYRGRGFLMGVPARDLTAQDVEAWELDEDMLVASGLYQKVIRRRVASEKSQEKKSRKTVGGE